MGVDSGTAFSDVDLEEGEWVDYDEKVTHYGSISPAVALLSANQSYPSGCFTCRCFEHREQVDKSLMTTGPKPWKKMRNPCTVSGSCFQKQHANGPH